MGNLSNVTIKNFKQNVVGGTNATLNSYEVGHSGFTGAGWGNDSDGNPVYVPGLTDQNLHNNFDTNTIARAALIKLSPNSQNSEEQDGYWAFSTLNLNISGFYGFQLGKWLDTENDFTIEQGHNPGEFFTDHERSLGGGSVTNDWLQRNPLHSSEYDPCGIPEGTPFWSENCTEENMAAGLCNRRVGYWFWKDVLDNYQPNSNDPKTKYKAWTWEELAPKILGTQMFDDGSTRFKAWPTGISYSSVTGMEDIEGDPPYNYVEHCTDSEESCPDFFQKWDFRVNSVIAVNSKPLIEVPPALLNDSNYWPPSNYDPDISGNIPLMAQEGNEVYVVVVLNNGITGNYPFYYTDSSGSANVVWSLDPTESHITYSSLESDSSPITVDLNGGAHFVPYSAFAQGMPAPPGVGSQQGHSISNDNNNFATNTNGTLTIQFSDRIGTAVENLDEDSLASFIEGRNSSYDTLVSDIEP